MNNEMYLAIAIAMGITAGVMVGGNAKKFIVPEGFCGLLYRHGKSLHRLSPGRHRFWRTGYTMQLVDLRKSILTVPGQEVLTADNVGLKISAVLTFQIIECETALHTVENYTSHLYNTVQLALRSVIGAQAVEALLGKRLDIGRELLALVKPEADKLGIQAHAVEVKDVMFPADLKKAFSEVLRAQKEGQAALERARGETAALRNLANAARMLDNNPALMNLRLMQSINAAGNAGNTLVMGIPTGFMPVKNGRPPGDGPHEK